MSVPVLLIDDDALVLSGIKRVLHGHVDVVLASSGADAVRMAKLAADRGEPFAVLVCDMHMPGLDGIETIRRIQVDSPLTVPIMLTGDADQHTAMRAINQGRIFRFYSKPFDARDLLQGIEQGQAQHRLLAAEQRLVENEARWRLALEAAGDGVFDWYPQTGRLILSEGWRRMVGAEDGDIRGDWTDWWGRVPLEDRPALTQALDQLLAGQVQDLRCEHRLSGKDAALSWYMVRGAVLDRDPQGLALRVIGTHVDISRHRQMEETLIRQAKELELLATTDGLTGLPNRRHFLNLAQADLDRAVRYGRPLSLIMLDIDHFKLVNDQHGHGAGDAVLSAFGGWLRGGMRKSDVPGRLGGEEFAVLLPETDLMGAVRLAENLRQRIEAEVIAIPDQALLRITASLGVVVLRKGESLIQLMNRADQGLYRAKQDGRNRVVA